MFKKILIAVDGSSHSKRAVDVAIDLTKRYRASVILLHVIRNLSLPKEILEMISSGEVNSSRIEILQDSAEIILGDAKEKFQEAGLLDVDVSTEFVIGDPAYKIVNCAAQSGADLILIGQRGIGPRGELLGSVARKLLNLIDVPCLVVT